jgi:hypothetical protein
MKKTSLTSQDLAAHLQTIVRPIARKIAPLPGCYLVRLPYLSFVFDRATGKTAGKRMSRPMVGVFC